MNIKPEKIKCASCGSFNQKENDLCEKCGDTIKACDRKKMSVMLLHSGIAMLSTGLFQILMLTAIFYFTIKVYGLTFFAHNIVPVAIIEIPLSIVIISLVLTYFFKYFTITEVTLGGVLYVLVLNIINVITRGNLSIYGLIMFVEITIAALSGAWLGKKLKVYFREKQ